MEITPIDIQQHQFKTRFMGYDKGGVDQFLEKVAEELENLHRENQGLKENLARTRQALEEMRQTESTLKEALLTTQQVTDGLKDNARQEAKLIVEEARLKAGKIINHGEQRRGELIEQIQEINRQKVTFETSLKGLIDRHQRMLAETSDWPRIPEALIVSDSTPAGKFPTADAILATEEEDPGVEVDEESEEFLEEVKENFEEVSEEAAAKRRDFFEGTSDYKRDWNG